MNDGRSRRREPITEEGFVDGRSRVAPADEDDPLLMKLIIEHDPPPCWDDGTCHTPVRCYLHGCQRQKKEDQRQ